MTGERRRATSGSYDRVARRYRERFAGELDGKPFDRAFLDDVAASSGGTGWLVDLGCGPAQIGAHLAGHGLDVLAIDVSFEMLREARTVLPGAATVQADMRSLPLADESVETVVSFHSLIHVPPPDLPAALGEIRRVLVAGGRLAVTFHIGDGESLHVGEMLDQAVDLDFHFYATDGMASLVEDAGLEVVLRAERDPYAPEVESQTRRAFLVARKPA